MVRTFRILFFLLLLPVLAYAQPATEEAFSPHQGGTDLIISTIGEAQQSILVAAYSFTSHEIAKALIEAHQRGIDVRVVLDGSQRTSRNSMPGWLAENGISVRFNSRYAIMHDKFIIVDNMTLETGSFNFTSSADTRNAENVLVLHDDPKAALEYTRQWEKLWGEATVD